ncbi:hypothetical protein M405DRAFT_803804 [Rhizopogon salebrosus TDB-379]|nr:hypothetical protein M405DRAFT_803804 [Rhizopogon salebrosus TDB-379]
MNLDPRGYERVVHPLSASMCIHMTLSPLTAAWFGSSYVASTLLLGRRRSNRYAETKSANSRVPNLWMDIGQLLEAGK